MALLVLTKGLFCCKQSVLSAPNPADVEAHLVLAGEGWAC